MSEHAQAQNGRVGTPTRSGAPLADGCAAGDGSPRPERSDTVHRLVAELGPPALVVAARRAAGARRVARTVEWANASASDLLTLPAVDVNGQPLGAVGAHAPADVDGDWRQVVADLVRRDGGQAAGVVQRTDSRQQPVWLRVTRIGDVTGTCAFAGADARAEPDGEAHSEPHDAPQEEQGTGAWLVQLSETSNELAVAREAALEAEHRFEALARRAPIGIFVSEVGLRLGYVNEAFTAMTGRPAELLLGTGWLDLVHATDRGQLYEAVESVLAGTHSEMSVRILTVANGQRWVQARLAPVTTPRRSAGFIGTMEDITARRAWEEQLAYQAMHDPLTGLANRRCLIQALDGLLEGQRAGDRQFAVLFCDLDGFKSVNDTLGHDAGDRVLIEVARRLASTARDRDVVARVAGDEFVVVLRSVHNQPDAQASARRHLAALAGPVYVSGRDIDISASVGVAFPVPGDTPETVLRAADRVMYEAKSTGPGQVRLAKPSSPGSARGADTPWTPPAPRRRLDEGGSR
jgi:diguanylate cyclase (GGDEF)-like protein/PAS domain S-box-containing protein